MAMTGQYIAIEGSLLNQIINGNIDILDIDPGKYQTLHVDIPFKILDYLLCEDNENIEPPFGYIIPIRGENELVSICDLTAFYLTEQQVKEVSQFLNMLEDSSFGNVCKSIRDNKIALSEDIKFLCEYIYFYLAELKEYFSRTAKQGYAIIFSVI